MRLAIRVVGGIALLVLVVWYAEPRALAQQLAAADRWLFAVAVVTAIGANLVSARRWAGIARALGLIAPTTPLILIYGRGITTNMLLPGATLSGDLLRSYQLAGLGNPFLRAALSVFFDRFSGLWVLCVMSLLAAIGLAVAGRVTAHELPAGFAGYVLLLVAVVAAPLLPWPTGWLRALRLVQLAKLADQIDALRSRLRVERRALLRSAWLSIVVQLLSALAFWLCGDAVGVDLSYASMLAAAAPIFVMAAVPVGVAGFGTRELAAVLVLGFFGIPGDRATAASLLFGLTGVAQGMLAAPLFLLPAGQRR